MHFFRLSRARRCVENAFGIMCARWQCLARTMFVTPDMAQKMIGACCRLHNFLMKNQKDTYAPPGFTDAYDENGDVIPGSFRTSIQNNSLFNTSVTNGLRGRPHKSSASQVRDHLKGYFNSTEGGVSWQLKSIFLRKVTP